MTHYYQKVEDNTLILRNYCKDIPKKNDLLFFKKETYKVIRSIQEENKVIIKVETL